MYSIYSKRLHVKLECWLEDLKFLKNMHEYSIFTKDPVKEKWNQQVHGFLVGYTRATTTKELHGFSHVGVIIDMVISMLEPFFGMLFYLKQINFLKWKTFWSYHLSVTCCVQVGAELASGFGLLYFECSAKSYQGKKFFKIYNIYFKTIVVNFLKIYIYICIYCQAYRFI